MYTQILHGYEQQTLNDARLITLSAGVFPRHNIHLITPGTNYAFLDSALASTLSTEQSYRWSSGQQMISWHVTHTDYELCYTYAELHLYKWSKTIVKIFPLANGLH